jgi:hypothetical protein
MYQLLDYEEKEMRCVYVYFILPLSQVLASFCIAVLSSLIVHMRKIFGKVAFPATAVDVWLFD